VVALSFVGTMDSNSHVASMLHDEDGIVREHASDALWEIWFRGGTNDQNELLLQILSLADFQQILENLNELIRVAPNFSEAWNQRAILYFRRGDYLRAIHDCEKVLQLNPFHFGAQAGMGQAWLKLRRYRSALRAFEMALQINPTLDDLRETIRDIRQAIEEDS
jgi:tetratricopeptide (TPR) repeat protein